MTGVSDVSDPRRGEIKTRIVPLLVIAPAGAVALVAALYLWLIPWLPQRVAIHMGPEGPGYGSMPLAITTICVIAMAAFAVGGATARGFMKADHWYQSEKLISVGIESMGYGVIGVGLATMVSTVGVEPNEVSGDSVAAGMFGFLFMFIASVCVYVAALPRGKMEKLGS